jgi:hypothetical protein
MRAASSPGGTGVSAMSYNQWSKTMGSNNTASDPVLEKQAANFTSGRRGLLMTAGFGAAALGAATLGMPTIAEAEQTVTDEDILNFALNLEYLEAEFYLRATTGQGLPPSATDGSGTQGSVTGGSQVKFKDPWLGELAAEIANDEYNHVLFLRKALGSAKVAEPAIDLSTSFTVLAQAAGLINAGQTFDPFSSDNAFLLGAYIFEDVGVTAYSGAAPLIASKQYLAAAAGILAVEAYHASEIRLKLLLAGKSDATIKISKLRAALSGAPDDQGVFRHGQANIVPTDKNSLAYARDTTQVLNIVYGGGSASNYLFFPDKLNGTIQ